MSSGILNMAKLEKWGFFEGSRSLREGMYFLMQLIDDLVLQNTYIDLDVFGHQANLSFKDLYNLHYINAFDGFANANGMVVTTKIINYS